MVPFPIALVIISAPFNISALSTYCSGSTTSTTLTITITGTGPFTGTLSDGTPFSGNASPVSVIVAPTSTTTYTIATLSDAGCTAQSTDLSGSATVTVNARPTGSISGSGTYCGGSNTATNLTLTVTGSGTINGTLSDGTPFSGTAPTITVSVAPRNTTIYTIATLSDAGCTAQPTDLTGSATVTVNTRPTGSLSGGATYCSGASTTTNLTVTVTGSGTISGTLSDGTSFSGTAPIINISVSPSNTTTYTIASLSDASCSAQADDLSGSATVTINATLAAPVSGGDQVQCAQSPLQTLTATATGGTITWYDAAAGESVVTSPTLSNVGTVTYYAQSSNGTCSSATRTPITLTINAAPAAPLSGGDQLQCAQSPVQTLTATASGGTITWYDAATGSNLIANPILSNVGTITYYAQSSNGSRSSLARTAVTLTIKPLPTVAVISYSGSTAVCSGSMVSLTDVTPGGVWTSSNAAATVNTSGTVTFATVNAATQVSVYYTVTSNGCSAQTALVFTVNPPLSINSITGATAICGIGSTTQLRDATGGGTWSSRSPAIATVNTTGVVTGKAAGSDTIYYTVSSGGCASTTQTKVSVNASPTVAAISGNGVIIRGNSTTLTDATKGGVWSSNTAIATVSTTGVVKGIAAGNCTIYYTLTSGLCSAAASKSINVYNPLTATVSSGKILCYGGTTTLTITASGESGGYQYSLNGNKFQTGNTFMVTAGAYIAVITDQMANQFTISGIVISQPAAVSARLISEINASSKTAANGSFTVAGTGGTAPYQYSKNGGSAYQTSSTFSNLTTGTYKISVKDANNCVALNVLTVNVGYGKQNLSSEVSGVLITDLHEVTDSTSAIVYPNPAKNVFHLQLKNSKEEKVEIRVMDVVGRQLYHTSGSSNGTYQFGNDFVGGMYLVEIIYENKIRTLKVMKQ